MVNYEVYHYDPLNPGYGDWQTGDTKGRGTTSLRAMKVNVGKALTESKAKSDFYVVAVLKGTKSELEGDYWTYLKYDVVVWYSQKTHRITKVYEDLTSKAD